MHAMTFVLCAAAAAIAPPTEAATQLDFAGSYSMRPPSFDSEDNADHPASEHWGTPEDAARPAAIRMAPGRRYRACRRDPAARRPPRCDARRRRDAAAKGSLTPCDSPAGGHGRRR